MTHDTDSASLAHPVHSAQHWDTHLVPRLLTLVLKIVLMKPKAVKPKCAGVEAGRGPGFLLPAGGIATLITLAREIKQNFLLSIFKRIFNLFFFKCR